MTTLSQFKSKSKYITERRSKNIGDEGTRNIVRKTFGRDAITNNDGGAGGQKRIEKEYNLNNTNKKNTSKLNLSNTKNVVNKDKFADVKKFQNLNKRAQEILNKSNNTVSDISKQNNIRKISQSEVKPIKPSTNVIKNVSNTTTNTVRLPNISKGNTSSLNVSSTRNINLPNFATTRSGNPITANLSNYKDPAVDKIIKDAENLKNPRSLKAYKQANKDFKTFISNKDVAKNVSKGRFAKGLTGVSAVLGVGGDYKASRDMGYNKAQSVARAGVMAAGKYIGGVKGAALGSKAGLIGAIPGGYYGYQLGGKGAEVGFDAIASKKGRRQLKKSFTNFMSNLRGNK